EAAEQGAAAGTGGVCGRGRRAVRADPGGRAPGERGRNRDRRRNVAAVDARRGPVEPGTEAQAVPATAGTAKTFRRVGATGRRFHEWLEKRGPRGCLMNMVDDATGTTLAQFSEQETTWSAVAILRAWMEPYGVARAL